MKSLHVTPFYEAGGSYGGMARAAAGLCRALARRGHDVTVATARLDASQPGDETVDGVQVRRFDGPALLRRWLIPWAPGLQDFLREQLPAADIVHVHGHRNGLAATTARVLANAGARWVVTTHGTFPHHGQRRWAKAILDRAAFDRVVTGASAVIAVSEAEARDLGRPARVVPNGVEICGRGQRVRPGQRKQLLFVGSDRPQKRGHLLVPLLAALPETELHLVGPFGRRFLSGFEALADRVVHKGVLSGDALATAYADADLVVHPAVGEAFGLVPFEAALLGTAAVVAGGHGCGEWYGRAGGCVVPPEDFVALRDSVRARLSDRERAAVEARAVAAFIRQHLTWDQAAAATESIYREVQNA